MAQGFEYASQELLDKLSYISVGSIPRVSLTTHVDGSTVLDFKGNATWFNNGYTAIPASIGSIVNDGIYSLEVYSESTSIGYQFIAIGVGSRDVYSGMAWYFREQSDLVRAECFGELAGTFGFEHDRSYYPPANTKISMRARLENDTFSFKVWTSSNNEPEDWIYTESLPITVGGSVQMLMPKDSSYLYSIGIGTDGDPPQLAR